MTTIEQVRLLIGDTGSVQYTDAQIQAFLDMAKNSIFLAAALALESWAATLTESASSEKIGDYAYTKKSADNKLKLAATYRENAAKTPAMTWAEMDFSDAAYTETA